MAGILNSEDELLVAGMRRALARVAAALDDTSSEDASGSAVGAALDGAEMVMRGELVSGNAGRLPALTAELRLLGDAAGGRPGQGAESLEARRAAGRGSVRG